MGSRLHSERLHSLASPVHSPRPAGFTIYAAGISCASIRAPYGVGVGVAVGVGVGLTTTTVVEVLVPSLGNFL